MVKIQTIELARSGLLTPLVRVVLLIFNSSRVDRVPPEEEAKNLKMLVAIWGKRVRQKKSVHLFN